MNTKRLNAFETLKHAVLEDKAKKETGTAFYGSKFLFELIGLFLFPFVCIPFQTTFLLFQRQFNCNQHL